MYYSIWEFELKNVMLIFYYILTAGFQDEYYNMNSRSDDDIGEFELN